MIISASRRTDIPALYPEWFMNRLLAEEVLVPNPYNRKKVSRIRLTPEVVDCFVFWTKNPEPMLPYLKMIDRLDYQYYFQMTVTDYEKDIEPHLPSTEESIATFILLSQRLDIAVSDDVQFFSQGDQLLIIVEDGILIL